MSAYSLGLFEKYFLISDYAGLYMKDPFLVPSLALCLLCPVGLLSLEGFFQETI